MNNEYCDGCVYCGKIRSEGLRYCRYMITTNKRRPCPPGEGCTVRVGMKVYRRKRKEMQNERM